ncbi:phage tail baseplate protein [Sphingomonas silueang]|uniref:GTA baseplate fiber-binding domain-containing protein n=1 Tax=Sphingomonas silueang TaxID=3156617 RepID=UPI0032B522C8
MATVVLTTLGRAVGGPVGSAIGGLVGRTIDGAVFGSRTRQGPRLRELQVQTSSYGSAIPRLFGTMRVAGTVIWATDLREHATTSGSKATGRTVNYSYSASFAVALSARPIRAVRRIWAEGKLLRGSAGDWKTRTGFRLYPGDEAQLPDPLIASIVGIDRAPAHRGIAYAVFEDLALADFGNRIPSLTFEVEADAAPLPVGAVVRALGDGAIGAAEAGPLLGGYAAEGESVRAAIETLVAPLGGWFAPAGDGLALRLGEGAAEPLPPPVDGGAWKRPPVAPADVTIAYHDAARDYQTGVQQQRQAGARIVERIELPAVLDGAVAAGIVADAARRRGLAGSVRTLRLDWRAVGVMPGARVTLADAPGRWRVRRMAIGQDGVTVELLPIAPATLPVAAAAGEAQLAADLLPGATRLLLVELPGDAAGGDAVPRIAAVAAGTGAGWRRAALLTGDGPTGLRDHGTTAAPGTIGRTVTLLAGGPTTIVDADASVEVALVHDAMTLAGADAAAIDRGANAALIGDEIVQFAAAQRIAPARWRLSGLWRGRRGTEWAVDGHQVGDPFVLLDPATLQPIDDPVPAIGREMLASAVGIAPDDVATATIVPDGRGIVPPAPVHGQIAIEGGQMTLRWVRRGRGDAGWRDGVDVALGEEREAWTITLTAPDDDVQVFDSDVAQLTIPCPLHPVAIAIRQIGTHGASRPLILFLPSENPA